ncbi:uncharacterized protein LOC143293498 isoform X2 [Babylonia areolata]
MSVLLVLPLLLAHRQPVHPLQRPSILRRMPMFYGKRDPALASPSFSGAFLPDTSHPHSAAVSKAAPEDAVDSSWFRNPLAGPRQGERHKGVKTWDKRRFASDGRSVDGVKRHSPWTVPSVLFTKLQGHLNRAVHDDGPNDIFTNEAYTQFSRSNIGHPSDARTLSVQSGEDGVHQKTAASGSTSREEILRRSLEILSAALGYDGDDHQDNLPPTEEDTRSWIPLEIGDAGDSTRNEDGLYYHFLNSAVMTGEDEDGDYESRDDTSKIEPVGTRQSG